MQITDLHVNLVTLEALPYLTRLNRAPTADDYDSAIGAGYRKLEAHLPFDEASDLYCDLDARWGVYLDAVRARYAEVVK
jgi:hypothetical protein